MMAACSSSTFRVCYGCEHNITSFITYMNYMHSKKITEKKVLFAKKKMHPTNSQVMRQRQRFTRFTCQICDKVFATQDTLNQHIATHRTTGKLPFRCNLCNAQYPTRMGLDQHKLTYHRGGAGGGTSSQGSEMVAPVVDLNQPGVIDKLTALGIRHCVVLNQIGEQPAGIFGLPIVSIDGASNPAQSNSGRGPPSTLSLGPPKPIR